MSPFVIAVGRRQSHSIAVLAEASNLGVAEEQDVGNPAGGLHEYVQQVCAMHVVVGETVASYGVRAQRRLADDRAVSPVPELDSLG